MNENAAEINFVDEPGFWSNLKKTFRAITFLCYFVCPPVPDTITKKIAFHPPKERKYSLVLKDNENTVVTVDELDGHPFLVIPTPDSHIPLRFYVDMMRNTSAFCVTTSKGNKLVGIHCKAKKVPRDPRLRQQVILFSQPNSSDLAGFLHPLSFNFPYLTDLYECDLVAYDYSGYGHSSGEPSEENIYSDIKAIYDHLRETIPNKKIVLIGYSLGTTCTIDLASKNKEGISGVVLIAPFTSGLRLLKNTPLQPNTYCIDRFSSVDKISKIRVPTLLCHGTKDNVIPHEHSLALHERLANPVPPLIVHGADHQKIFTESLTRIYSFLRCETDLEGENCTELDEIQHFLNKICENDTDRSRNAEIRGFTTGRVLGESMENMEEIDLKSE